MHEQASLWAAVLPVIDLFASLDVPYYIGGSIASSYSGVARATQDADLVADLRMAHAMLFVRALEDRYYLSQERVLSAIRERKSFNLIHLETTFKVDIFVLPPGDFARQAMSRRVAFEIQELDRAVDFCSAEDIVLEKLRWYERGHRVSDRQWYDLQGVLRLGKGRLDLGYLLRWAKELDLEGLLERALGEAGYDLPEP